MAASVEETDPRLLAPTNEGPRQHGSQPARPPARRSTLGGPGLMRRIRAAGQTDVASTRFIAHARLDRRLQVLARRPERFTGDALRLCVALDARGFDLEISDPSLWRVATGSTSVTVERQFCADIEGVRTMGREEELRLALRIEFAKIRLDRALARHGLSVEDLADGTEVPPDVCRRGLEWHALRLEMVERNLYLVLINVERYRHTSADRSDLIQAAAAALLRAVDGFDWRRGVLFKTYAVYWLHQGFRGHFYDFISTVRIPVYLQKALRHVNAAIQRLDDPHASVEEIARETGLSNSIVASARSAARKTRSLDAPLDNSDDPRTLATGLALKNDEGPYSIALEDVTVASGVEAVLGKLTGRERHVVKMRFGIGYVREHIYAEIAEDLGISLERVRQILVRAMTKMRTPLLRKTLAPLVT